MFVTLEGIEGSGKSTLLAGLAERLKSTGADPLVTYEPGGTPIGDAVRELLLGGVLEMTSMTEALLMNASRAELVARRVRPALAAGRVVLCDRYTDSTLAYQGYARGLDLPMLRLLCLTATGGLEPDVTLLIDIPVERSSARLEERGALDRLDRSGEEFFERARRGYLEMAKSASRWRTLDGTLPPGALLDAAWDVVRPLLP